MERLGCRWRGWRWLGWTEMCDGNWDRWRDEMEKVGWKLGWMEGWDGRGWDGVGMGIEQEIWGEWGMRWKVGTER